MMQVPPGMMQLLASMALTNPDKLAMMAAAKGIQPPETAAAMAMPPGLSSPIGSAQMPVGPAAPAGPAIDPTAMMSGLGALAPPSAAGGGGGGGNAPAPFIPGALASQMPQIMAMLMQSGGANIPGIGAQVLGR